jgi:hypothetical protein
MASQPSTAISKSTQRYATEAKFSVQPKTSRHGSRIKKWVSFWVSFSRFYAVFGF